MELILKSSKTLNGDQLSTIDALNSLRKAITSQKDVISLNSNDDIIKERKEKK